MKKLILIIVATLMGIVLFVACKETKDTVAIKTDRNIYIVAMSSASGIRMTPDFKSNKKHAKLEYHWITESGEFVSDFSQSGKELMNEGETVLWSGIENDKIIDISGNFDIYLDVIDSETKKILANTKLTVKAKSGSYEIKK